MDQFSNRAGIEAEALLGDGGYEAGAGFEIGIVKFAAALVLFEVVSILGRKECALVMIEPPGNLGRAGVFEVDNGVFVAVKICFVEKRAGAMQQA